LDDDLTAAGDRAYSAGKDFGGVLDQIAASVAASARTTRDGLGAFAETELGVSVDVLFGAWGCSSLPIIAEHADALDAAEADAEGLDLFARTLDVAWRKHGLLDASVEPDDELRAVAEAAGW
jgi:hypothetical protein